MAHTTANFLGKSINLIALIYFIFQIGERTFSVNTIDFGAEFEIRVSYVVDETKFLVTMDNDGPFEYFLWGHWDVKFKEVQTEGDMEIEFVGFVAPGIM